MSTASIKAYHEANIALIAHLLDSCAKLNRKLDVADVTVTRDPIRGSLTVELTSVLPTIKESAEKAVELIDACNKLNAGVELSVLKQSSKHACEGLQRVLQNILTYSVPDEVLVEATELDYTNISGTISSGTISFLSDSHPDVEAKKAKHPGAALLAAMLANR